VPQGHTPWSLVESREADRPLDMAGRGSPARHKVRDASFCNGLAWSWRCWQHRAGFPLINKSFNLAYAATICEGLDVQVLSRSAQEGVQAATIQEHAPASTPSSGCRWSNGALRHC
jgi:hypothetical protein